jgi:hypothetical protein
VTATLLVHHRVGGDVKVAELEGLTSEEARTALENFGKLRQSDGVWMVSDARGVRGMIPARNIEYVEVKYE